MDGFTPLVLEEKQMSASVPAPQIETGEWVAMRVGDSAMIVWFPREQHAVGRG